MAKKDAAVVARKKVKESKATPFSERISLLRKRVGLTMTALSERIQVTPSYISLLESGERQPSRDVVDKLTEVFFLPNEINARDELRMLAGLSPVQTEKIIAPHNLRTSYEQLIEKNPDDFRSFSTLIRILLKSHEDEIARQRIHEGLRRFSSSFQLQALLAQLELSHGHFQGAETAQRAAIEQFLKTRTQSQDKATCADLYISLGTIYALWGDSFLNQAGGEPQKQTLELLKQARKQYGIALEMVPENVYLLDEYARLCVQLAKLSQDPERSKLCEESIRTFRQVICAENNPILGQEAIREACISMANACCHAGRFDEAELILVLTRSMSPDFWPAPYALACLYSQQYSQSKETRYLDKAFNSLRQAFKLQSDLPALRQLAHSEQALNPLRQKRRKVFDELCSQHSPALTG